MKRSLDEESIEEPPNKKASSILRNNDTRNVAEVPPIKVHLRSMMSGDNLATVLISAEALGAELVATARERLIPTGIVRLFIEAAPVVNTAPLEVQGIQDGAEVQCILTAVTDERRLCSPARGDLHDDRGR